MGEEYFNTILGVTLWTFVGASYAMRSRGGFAWYKLFMAGPLVWLLFFTLLLVLSVSDLDKFEKDKKDKKDD